MATFVHLTFEKNRNAIIRSGIKARKGFGDFSKSFFAMPVVQNFYVSHQWLRELRRAKSDRIIAVYFKIDDEEIVHVGHYNNPHVEMTAAQATAVMMESEIKEGYEIIITKSISAKTITKIKHIPQVIGWRYYPKVRDSFYCGCPICIPYGSIRGNIKRKTWEQKQRE